MDVGGKKLSPGVLRFRHHNWFEEDRPLPSVQEYLRPWSDPENGRIRAVGALCDHLDQGRRRQLKYEKLSRERSQSMTLSCAVRNLRHLAPHVRVFCVNSI